MLYRIQIGVINNFTGYIILKFYIQCWNIRRKFQQVVNKPYNPAKLFNCLILHRNICTFKDVLKIVNNWWCLNVNNLKEMNIYPLTLPDRYKDKNIFIIFTACTK
jgi:hypothetical protein